MKTCKDDNLGINFTFSSIHNIKDMINHIKTINQNYNLFYTFKRLYSNMAILENSKDLLRNHPIKKINNRK